MQYDYLIVGAGLYGATFARRMTDAGKRCLVIERRGHIAGNAYTQDIAGIDVHVYGAHIFHTSSERVWSFVNRFGQVEQLRPLANGELLRRTVQSAFQHEYVSSHVGRRYATAGEEKIESQLAGAGSRNPQISKSSHPSRGTGFI
jgi:UDP-galactopyranose mutase